MARRTMAIPVVSSSFPPFTPSRREEATDVGDASTGYDAFGDGCAGCAECVVDTVFLFFHLNFGGRADMEYGNSAGKLGETFLELFAVVVALGLLNLCLDLGNALCDGVFSPAPLTIVVFSLFTFTFSARPRSLMVAASSFMPFSSEITTPPVRIAMSSSISLRRSPNPGLSLHRFSVSRAGG